MSEAYKEAVKNYSDQYGPLTAALNSDTSYWSLDQRSLALGRRNELVCGNMKRDCSFLLISRSLMRKWLQFIMSQYGGPDGEMGASLRYLSQRYSMPYKECKGALTDIGTEELGHLEIVAAIIHQLTKGLSAKELVDQGFGPYYIDHATGIWPPGSRRNPL